MGNPFFHFNLRKLIDDAQDGVFFVSRDRKITYWNEGAQQLSGYSASEAIGKSCLDDFLGHADGNGNRSRMGAIPPSARRPP